MGSPAGLWLIRGEFTDIQLTKKHKCRADEQSEINSSFTKLTINET